MVIVDLDAGEIGNAVFPFGKNSVAVGAMNAVQNLPFFRALDQCCTCLLSHVIRNIIFHRFLCRAVAECEGGEKE